MLSKPSNRKQTTENFSRKEFLKIIKNRKNNLTVFEPKHPFRVCYITNAIPLSQTSAFNIKCFNWDLEDSPICLDLGYFQPKK